MANKKTIKLSESKLNDIVKESVMNILRETTESKLIVKISEVASDLIDSIDVAKAEFERSANETQSQKIKAILMSLCTTLAKTVEAIEGAEFAIEKGDVSRLGSLLVGAEE